MKKESEKLEPKFAATPEELESLYRKFRKEFTIEDLKAFQVEEKDMVPFSRLVAELEEMVQQAKAQRNQQ